MLQDRAADEVKTIERDDESLTRARVTLEGPDIQLRARNGRVERRALLAREREVDFSGQAANLAAAKAVCTRLIIEGLDVGRDERVHCLRDVDVEEDVGRARVEDDAALAFGERGCLAVQVSGTGSPPSRRCQSGGCRPGRLQEESSIEQTVR